jgi:hypothetical protein
VSVLYQLVVLFILRPSTVCKIPLGDTRARNYIIMIVCNENIVQIVDQILAQCIETQTILDAADPLMFTTGNVLEERKDVMELRTRRGDVPGWPEYLSRMMSLATPFSVFVFTRKEFEDEALAR